METFAENLEKGWGSGVAISFYAPSRANDPHVRDYWARYQQLSASPTAAMRYFWATVETDVTDLLPAISAPTLVICGREDQATPLEKSENIANAIPGARLVVFDGLGHTTAIEDPAAVSRELLPFVERVLART